jgi:hypothetical protein
MDLSLGACALEQDESTKVTISKKNYHTAQVT